MKFLLIALFFFTVSGLFGEVQEKENLRQKLIKHGILAAQISAKLNAELKVYGISGREILAAVRKNPAQFRVAVPEHTRKRLIIILPQHEKIISDSMIDEYRKNKKIYSDPAAEKKVHKVITKLQKGSQYKLPARFFLISEAGINAYCLPDGSILVTRGAVTTLSEKQLAAVLAHEAGHAVARHGAENITKMLVKSAAEVYADHKMMESITRKKNVQAALIKLGYGLGSQVGFLLPYSRKMEFEADKLGMIFLKRAGYDPKNMVDLLQFLEKSTPNSAWYEEYLSTHPLNPKRIKYVQTILETLKSDR